MHRAISLLVFGVFILLVCASFTNAKEDPPAEPIDLIGDLSDLAIWELSADLLSAVEGTDLYPASRNGQWGYVGRNGQMAIEPKFDLVWPFSGGRGRVMLKGNYGFVNPSGEIQIGSNIARAWDFSEGLAMVMVGDKVGYIDTLGNMAIEPMFGWGTAFSEDLAGIHCPTEIEAGGCLADDSAE